MKSNPCGEKNQVLHVGVVWEPILGDGEAESSVWCWVTLSGHQQAGGEAVKTAITAEQQSRAEPLSQLITLVTFLSAVPFRALYEL